jgi:hypothetical protein
MEGGFSVCSFPSVVIPWLDHGIHAVAPPYKVSERGNAMAWIAGSSRSEQSAFQVISVQTEHALVFDLGFEDLEISFKTFRNCA